MRPAPALLTVGTFLLALALAVTPATAEALAPSSPDGADDEHGFVQCGPATLVFHNPDLRPQDDGLVHASGEFFIQFQVMGDRAEDAERLAFSFGEPMPDEALEDCDNAPFTGAYYQEYRGDDDPESGFFIPINTTNVPDGVYGAAVTAYDADDEIVAHMYTEAVVENGCAASCRTEDDGDVQANDGIAPWPWVLPGDGDQVHDAGGLTVEFAEPVEDVRAWIQRPADEEPTEITGELEVWEVPYRPDDPVKYPHSGTLSEKQWGDGFHWDEPVPDDSIVRVHATDLNGNEAEKVIHVGAPTEGGIVTVDQPDVQVKPLDATAEAEPGDEVTFQARLVNVGEGEAHVDLAAAAPDDVRADPNPHHVMVPPGEEADVDVHATVSEEAANASYTLALEATYPRGDTDVTRSLDLTLDLENPDASTDPEPEPEPQELDENGTGDEASNETPAPLGLGLAVALLAALVRGRRR